MKNYKLPVLALAAASVFMFTGCDPDDDPINELEVPSTYVFERDGSCSELLHPVLRIEDRCRRKGHSKPRVLVGRVLPVHHRPQVER